VGGLLKELLMMGDRTSTHLTDESLTDESLTDKSLTDKSTKAA
jgi:hypothetical protein